VADDWADPISGATFPAPTVAPPDQNAGGFWGSLVPQYLASKGLQGQYLGNLARSLYTLPERATQAAGSLQYGGSYDPGPALESAGLVMGGTSFGAPSGAIGAGPIRAYHGSPYDFERFDINRIGTGEGAQAYGHGLYFAENPDVAFSYKTAPRVTDMDWPVVGGDPNWRVPAWVARTAQSSPRALDEVRANFAGRVKEAQIERPENVRGLQDIVDALDAVKAGKAELKKPGHMYEVNIRADPEQFLNWDAPLAQQPQAIQEMWARQFPAIGNPARRDIPVSQGSYVPESTGEQIYRQLEIAKHQPGAGHLDRAIVSQALNEAGIPGIRYLDQGSRGNAAAYARELEGQRLQLAKTTEALKADPSNRALQQALAHDQDLLRQLEQNPRGTSNYVLFRDDIIDILRKYGLAGGMAGRAVPYAFAPSNAELNQ
jgi:hypothetical protein